MATWSFARAVTKIRPPSPPSTSRPTDYNTHVTNENINHVSSYLWWIYLLFPLTYNFLCLQGPISHSRIVFFELLKVTLDRLRNENSTALTKVHADLKRAWPMAGFLACSRRSDRRAQENNSRRKKKRGQTRGGKGSLDHTPPALYPAVFPVYNFNSLPTNRRALPSERLAPATRFSKRGLAVKFASLT